MIRLILFLLLAAYGFAANGIVTGAVTVDSTFECLSVTAAFTNDDNGNATVVVEYKATSSGTYLPAYSAYIDRRATIQGHANPHPNEARVNIVGLTQGTSYDVRVTWTDADGVTGTNPITSASNVTVTWTPPTGGSTITCNNDSDFTSALASVVAGQTIHLNNGTYTSRTVSVSGNSGAWIKIEGGTGAVVGGGNISVTNSGDFIWYSGFTVAANGAAPGGSPFQQYGIYIGTTSDHILCDTLTFTSIGGSGGLSANNYGTSGIVCDTGSHHVYAKGCTFNTSNSSTDYNTSYVFGFSLAGGTSQSGTFIVTDCTFNGNFRDPISSEGGSWGDGYVYNCAIIRNSVNGGFFDDSIEVDGEDRLLVVLGNTMTCTTGSNGVSLAPCLLGPAYIVRNFFKGTDGASSSKLGNGGGGPEYFFHNTFWATGSTPWTSPDGLSDTSTAYSELLTSRNNVYYVNRYPLYRAGTDASRGNSYNYDALFSIVNGFVASEWNPSTTNANYTTLANFIAGASQETNGVAGDPLLNTNGTLQGGSPAANAGLALANFNGANSLWPYSTANPSIGAFELNTPSSTSASVLSGKITLTGKFQIK